MVGSGRHEQHRLNCDRLGLGFYFILLYIGGRTWPLNQLKCHIMKKKVTL